MDIKTSLGGKNLKEKEKKKNKKTRNIIILCIIIFVGVFFLGRIVGKDNGSSTTVSYPDAESLIQSVGLEVKYPEIEYLVIVDYLSTVEIDITEENLKIYKDSLQTNIKAYEAIFDSLISRGEYYDTDEEMLITNELLASEGATLDSGSNEEAETVDLSNLPPSAVVNQLVDTKDLSYLFYFTTLLPDYVSGEEDISANVTSNVDTIIKENTYTDEEYSEIALPIESTYLINIIDDSEAGFNIQSLSIGQVTVSESNTADSSKGYAYPESNESDGLKTCYQATETGNYSFSNNSDSKSEGLYAVYSDYTDCIKGKYYLSSAVKRGYSQGVDGDTTASDGSISKDEVFEILPIYTGEFVEVNNVQVQKVSEIIENEGDLDE